jgi:Icc protein
MAEARKLVLISDSHLTASGEVEGVACKARLEQAVAQISRHHSDALACVGTGDLADSGEPAAYAAVAQITARLPMPFLPMIGNHDSRDAFRAALPPPGDAMAAYQQFRWDTGDLTLLCLDSLSPGEDGGRLDDERLAWLEAQLDRCAGRRVLVFVHHPPAQLWLGLQDEIMLHEPEPLLALLKAYPAVEYLFCGHVHRPVSGLIGGLPFTTLRALAHQTRPGHGLTDWADFVARDERPAYGVIWIADDRIAIHAVDLEEPA